MKLFLYSKAYRVIKKLLNHIPNTSTKEYNDLREEAREIMMFLDSAIKTREEVNV